LASRVVLHIGTMKSGTTFIQSVLGTNRERLREQGLLFAGERWRDQIDAVRGLTAGGDATESGGAWQRLVDQIRAWPGTAVVSMEFLGPRQLPKIRLIQEAFADADVQVVLTARDLARNLPAMWIESTQNRATATWEQYLELVRAEDMSGPNPGRAFWRQQDVPGMAKRWSTAFGHDHFTLVTVPRPGAPRDLLWSRFAGVAGIDPGSCDLTARSNPSIGAASAELLRRLNVRLTDTDLTEREYYRLVKHTLAKQTLARHADSAQTMAVSERWVLRRSNRDVARLRKLGVRVVGDLDELISEPVEGLREVGTEAVVEAAVAGLAEMVGQQLTQLRKRVEARTSGGSR
jgi:hypothetical protein